MVRFTIDQELVKKLLSTSEAIELCDTSGRLVRRIPAEPTQQDTQGQWPPLPKLSEEEFERRCNDPGPWLTTEEFKQKLRT